MSVLETPRIYFKGQMSWDPITTNNYQPNYDENTGEAILPAAVDRVKAYREQSVAQVGQIGNWNPHGTHRSSFFGCSVCGFDLGQGVRTDDPFVGADASFTGMLVDLEPYGSFSSQLFFDSMRFGVDGGYRIFARSTSRVTARYINFARNSANAMIAGVASVVWQTSFETKDAINPFDSPALQALAAALEQPGVQGLTVRFNAYRTIYYDDPTLRNGSQGARAAAQALIAKLRSGGFQPNPARSLLVGVVGLWRPGEPAHEPGDRALLPPTGNSPAATAYVRFNPTSVAIDLSNSVSETDDALTKRDFGAMSLVSVDPNSGAVSTLATIPYGQYDRTAYEASAGIVTAPLTPGAATGGALQLLDGDGGLLLAELPLRVVPTTPNLYLSEGEAATATFQVYQNGAPAAGPLPVTLYKLEAPGGPIDSSQDLTTDAAGLLSVPLTGTAGGGINAYVPTANLGEAPPAQGLNTQTNTYMYVRTLPADANVATLAPTWANVYARVLANWNALAPCMDNWLNLANPDKVRAHAGVLKRLTDPANFESFHYMPVTRDMTAGERTLLYNFLDAPAPDAAAAPAPAVRAAAVTAAEEKPLRGRAAVSRALRRP